MHIHKLFYLILILPFCASAVQFTPVFSGQDDYPAGSGRYAEYEREIQPITPTAGHGVSCATSQSQQNSQASDEYFVTENGSGTTHFEAFHNVTSHSWRKVFVCPGDYSDDGLYASGEIWIKQGGTDTGADHEHDTSWLSFVWWDDDESDDGDNPYSWNDPGSPGAGPEMVILPRIQIFDVNAILFQGTTHVSRLANSGPMRLTAGTSADDIIFNRAYINPTLNNAAHQSDAVIADGGNQYITIQSSVITGCGYRADIDDSGIATNGADNFYVVNNELFDCTANITGSCDANCDSNATIIENNDLYHSPTSYTGLAGAPGVDESPEASSPTGSGAYSCRENLVALKGATPTDDTAANRSYIIGNRFWGSRPGFAGGASCTCGSSGQYTNAALLLYSSTRNTYVGNNIFFDIETQAYNAGAARTPDGPRTTSFNGNIIHGISNNDLRDPGSGGTCGSTQTPVDAAAIRIPTQEPSNEYRFNSLIDITGGTTTDGDILGIYNADASNTDFECNLFINTEAIFSPTSPTSGWVNHNAFIGTTVKSVTTETVDNYSTTLEDWAVDTGYSAGDIISPTSGGACTDGTQAQCFKYIAEDAGTSHASTQPAWPTVLGSTVVDNAGASQIKWRAILGQGSFTIKGWTNPTTKWLPYLVPWYDPATSSVWDNHLICAGQVVGDRTGYGIDNTTYDYR